jgi:hypothetical protein
MPTNKCCGLSISMAKRSDGQRLLVAPSHNKQLERTVMRRHVRWTPGHAAAQLRR